MPRSKPRPSVTASTPKVFRIVGGRVSTKPPAPAAVEVAVPPPATEEQVRELAYRKWEAAGRPEGDGVAFWLEAERELARR